MRLSQKMVPGLSSGAPPPPHIGHYRDHLWVQSAGSSLLVLHKKKLRLFLARFQIALERQLFGRVLCM